MKSTEKLAELVDQAQTKTDADLEDAISILPAGMTRIALMKLPDVLPNDADELDGLLEQIATFCMNARSDDAPA